MGKEKKKKKDRDRSRSVDSDEIRSKDKKKHKGIVDLGVFSSSLSLIFGGLIMQEGRGQWAFDYISPQCSIITFS